MMEQSSPSRRPVLPLAVRVVALAVVVSAFTSVQRAKDGYGPGARVLVDAHNCYPYEGQYADRIDRALSTGLPVAIEQDLAWYVDPVTHVGRSVVTHKKDDTTNANAPTFEHYFFDKVAPLMERALRENKRDEWPLITLNLDFKSNEPAHHAAVLALLAKYDRWLTTAERTASINTVAPLKVGPMLVLTGANNQQERSFFDNVPVGQRLRLFGAIPSVEPKDGDDAAKARAYVRFSVDTLIPNRVNNYRRWVNFPWSVVEEGGQPNAGDWSAADQARLRALVARAHTEGLWIRFYTLNGHGADEEAMWGHSYNFGSLERAKQRWQAAIDSHVDFLATDQYELFAKTLHK